MKIKVLILPLLFVVIVAVGVATYWFYNETINTTQSASNITSIVKSADTKQKPQAANVSEAANVSAIIENTSQASTEKNQAVSSRKDRQNKASNESLYELKNSIQDVIADSVQDEIQEAVENKIIKANDNKSN